MEKNYIWLLIHIYNCTLIQMQETNSLKPSQIYNNIILIDRVLKLDIYDKLNSNSY